MARQLLNASQSEPCFSDGLGLRFVRTLGTGETVEALRLRPELAALRESIRDRMNRLATFRQASFLPVRDTAAVPHQPWCLEVVSDHVPGVRLSEILEAARARRIVISTTAALHVVRGLLGALAVLAESRSLAHGAVGPERVLLASKGRLIVTDYVYGLALERLECSQRKLWQDFRIPLPSGARTPSFDARADLLQIGLVAIALLIGRPIESEEFPLQIANLAGSLSVTFEGDRRGVVARSVKAWLGRMLESDASRPFPGAREALAALEEALAPQHQSAGQASPVRLLVNSYTLAMAGSNADPVVSREPIEAPAALAQTERPTLDGDFTREIQVESIAQPPRIFETQGAGLEGTSRRRRRRTEAAPSADREDTGEHARASRARGDVVRRAVTRGVGLAAAGFLLPFRVCLAALRVAFSGARHAVSAVAATLTAAGAGGRAVLSAIGAVVLGAASGAGLLGRLSGGLATSTAGELGRVVRGAGTIAWSSIRGAGVMARSSGRGAGATAWSSVRGAGAIARSSIRGAGAVARSSIRGAGAIARSSGRSAGGVVRAAGTLLDGAGGGAIRAAQLAWVALRRTSGFAASLFSAKVLVAGGGIRAALSGVDVAGRSLGRRCGRALVNAARGTGRSAAAAAQSAVHAVGRGGGATVRAVGATGRSAAVAVQAAVHAVGRAVGGTGRSAAAAGQAAVHAVGRGGGATVRAVGVAVRAVGVTIRTVGVTGRAMGATVRAVGTGIARVAVVLIWSTRHAAAALGAVTAAMARGAAGLGRMLQRRVWPAGIAAISAGARLTVTAARAARVGATRLNPHPELRLQLLASALVLLVTVYGIQLVRAHWSDGVAATAQVSHTLTSGIKRADPRQWWPARQPGTESTTLEGGARLNPAPAPRPADAGSLTVSSSPDGAEVWLDGDVQGRAPITLDGVSAGAHTVLVRGRTGSVRRAVRVQPGGTAEVAINIYSGWLVVFAPIGLDVLEHGRSIGTSETGRIRLSPGEHQLEIVNERIGFRESRTPEITPGDTVAINVELPPALLEISAPPDTEVLIDGQLIAKTPTEPVPVAVGTREVTLRHPTLGEQRQTVTITYRTPNRILFRPPG